MKSDFLLPYVLVKVFSLKYYIKFQKKRRLRTSSAKISHKYNQTEMFIWFKSMFGKHYTFF